MDFPVLPPHDIHAHPIVRDRYSTPSLHSSKQGYGILTVCPSGAAFAIPLGPTNPPSIIVAEETSVFQRAGFSPALWLLVPAFSPRNAPAWVTPLPSARLRALSYRSIRTNPNQALSFGTMLSPDYLRRKDSR